MNAISCYNRLIISLISDTALSAESGITYHLTITQIKTLICKIAMRCDSAEG